MAGEKSYSPCPCNIPWISFERGHRVLSFSNVIATQHVAWKTDVLGPMVCFRDREVGAQMLKICFFLTFIREFCLLAGVQKVGGTV